MPKRLEDYETNSTDSEEDSAHFTAATKYHQCRETTTKQLFHLKQVSGSKQWKLNLIIVVVHGAINNEICYDFIHIYLVSV